MISRAIRHYISRFHWEIAIFWIFSISATIAAIGDAEPAIRLGLARLEIIGIVWITIRLLLAEDGFKTSGGWHARPVSDVSLLVAQVFLTIFTLLLPLTIRVLLLQRMLGIDATGWAVLIKKSWWPEFIQWTAFACVVKLFGLLILRGIDGKARIAAWCTLAIIVIPCTALVGSRYHSDSSSHNGYGNSVGGPGLLAQGIQQQLPDATDFIGMWNDRNDRSDSKTVFRAASLALRVPLRSDAALVNARLLEVETGIQGVRVIARVRFLTVDPELVKKIGSGATAILCYADGTYATCWNHVTIRNDSMTPLFAATEVGFAGEFVSPLSQPEFEGNPANLIKGAELLFFNADYDKPPLKPEIERITGRSTDERHGREQLHLERLRSMAGDPSKLREFSHALVDQANLSGESWFSNAKLAPLIRQLPAEAVPFVLERFPWSEDAWKDFVSDFLVKHATRADIPALLERMRYDPRVGAVFVEKGWSKECMPVLRQLAGDRLPLDSACVAALAREKDPGLAEDLTAVALQMQSGLEKDVESALRGQPGFDWAAFAKEAWRRAKYRGAQGEFWTIALWAAQEGDFSAFRETAEQAARGKKWEAEQLRGLVAGEHADLIGYLRENIDKMTFDPEARRWVR